MKKCAFCAGEIQDDAVRCSFCGQSPAALPPVPAELKTPWYLSSFSIIAAFITVGPLAIPLVWLRKGLSLRAKIIYTFLMIAFTVLLVVILGVFLRAIMNYYQTLTSL